jgi:hypothetical protein
MIFFFSNYKKKKQRIMNQVTIPSNIQEGEKEIA